HGVLLSIAGGSDLGLFEINEAASLVQESAHPDANIIFGTVIDDSLGDEVRVTVIAAGFDAGGPSHKKLNPSPVAARTVASGQSGKVGQSSRSPQAPTPAPAAATPPRQAAPHPTNPQPTNTAWQPATGPLRPGPAAPTRSVPGRPAESLPGRAIPVTGDFDDDDEVDVPPFMRR
ncbi:MAG: cell division protein FtsZ, partial [Pseudonocardiaceae bacterium]